NVELNRLAAIWPEVGQIAPAIAAQIAVDARYASYVRRQELDVEALRKDEALRIPPELDFGSLPGLSSEVRQKLTLHRPTTLAQAARIDGVTPAALLLLLAQLKAQSARKSA
ncbi:MAG: tRNA uridine-5-carboxymethylaminomethyl(34) synthesis enzyme MnmG, partial [Alphaproteobacteria bacterium]